MRLCVCRKFHEALCVLKSTQKEFAKVCACDWFQLEQDFAYIDIVCIAIYMLGVVVFSVYKQIDIIQLNNIFDMTTILPVSSSYTQFD